MNEKPVVKSNFLVKELYPYQKASIKTIISKLNAGEGNNNILFQLPTGGGKTIIFSHIANEFIRHNLLYIGWIPRIPRHVWSVRIVFHLVLWFHGVD